MSVDALVQVFRDHREVAPGVQAVLVALAWRTPQGRDTTYPTSYRDIANLTRQHPNTVRRNLAAAITSGAAEVVWARQGQPSRYRVNRGEWFVPGSPADLEAALGMVDPAHDGRAHDARGVQGQFQIGAGTPRVVEGDRARGGTPLRNKEEKDEAFAASNPDLVQRLREKGVIE